MDIKNKLNIYILAQEADAGPPLGTILGNLGVNSTNFCKEFNAYTAEIPNYITLGVTILVYTNRSYKFTINELPLGKLIGLFQHESTVSVQGKETIINCISLKNIVQLSLFKFPHMHLKQAIPILLGSIKSANLKIVY
jgi:large subunit ribosomal protein L11